MPRLQEIEDSAGEAFREVGMDLVADDPPPGEDVLSAYIRSGWAWVSVDANVVVAYLVAEVVDGALHIEQVSVHPDYAGRRLGQGLIERAAAEALQTGLDALTLTTFADVPWNAPYYARLGFDPVPEEDLTPGLTAIRDEERSHGLDRWPRLAMRRSLQ